MSTNFITYNYIDGTQPGSGSNATITFNGINSSPDSYSNLGASGNYKTIGFTYISDYENDVYFKITPNQGAIDVYYIFSQNAPNSTQNFNASNYYTSTTGLYITELGTTDGWKILSTTTIDGDPNVTIDANGYYYFNVTPSTYLTIIFSKNGAGSGLIETYNVEPLSLCFASNSLVLMSDKSYKEIKDIKRNDEIIMDIKTNKKIKVSRNILNIKKFEDIYLIPKELIQSRNDIIGRGIHPIWVNNNERCLIKNIDGVIKLENYNNKFYNLQFDIEGTFYIENIKVDSVSPNHKKFKLKKKDYINKDLYKEDLIVYNENDKIRNKPLLKYNIINPLSIETINNE